MEENQMTFRTLYSGVFMLHIIDYNIRHAGQYHANPPSRGHMWCPLRQQKRHSGVSYVIKDGDRTKLGSTFSCTSKVVSDTVHISLLHHTSKITSIETKVKRKKDKVSKFPCTENCSTILMENEIHFVSRLERKNCEIIVSMRRGNCIYTCACQ